MTKPQYIILMERTAAALEEIRDEIRIIRTLLESQEEPVPIFDFTEEMPTPEMFRTARWEKPLLRYLDPQEEDQDGKTPKE